MIKPTPRQAQILNFIYEFTQQNQFAPTLAEMAVQFKVSPVSILELTEALIKKGYLAKTPNAARGLTVNLVLYRQFKLDSGMSVEMARQIVDMILAAFEKESSAGGLILNSPKSLMKPAREYTLAELVEARAIVERENERVSKQSDSFTAFITPNDLLIAEFFLNAQTSMEVS